MNVVRLARTSFPGAPHPELRWGTGADDAHDGRFLGFETLAKQAAADLAYVVEIERLEAKVHGGEETSPYALRVTMVFRAEEGAWKVVHRHADQVTTD